MCFKKKVLFKFGAILILLIAISLYFVDPDEILKSSRITIRYYTGRSSEDLDNIQNLTNLGRMQNATLWPKDFFCNVTHGAGRRSATPPTSVHRLRAGDIDIIGALGDSITAGSTLMGRSLLDFNIDNRGLVFSIGGQGTWRQYLTLPNILKEYNPQLYGYALRDSLSTERDSRFNPAEPGAIFLDMPYMARILHKRMSRDPFVNMTHHWKIVTMFVGGNDICAYLCHAKNYDKYMKQQEINLLKTFRYLRDNVPRLLVNYIPSPNMNYINQFDGLPDYCNTLHKFECGCVYNKDADYLENLVEKIRQFIAMQRRVVALEEFNTETFTISTRNVFDFPEDARFNQFSVTVDCFHLSQASHAAITSALWNNMHSYDGKSYHLLPKGFEDLICPTDERPYITTRENLQPDFNLNS